MISYKDPLYIVNGDMSLGIVGPWINTCGFEYALFQASWSTVAGTGGTFGVEGTCDAALNNVVTLPAWGPTATTFASQPVAGSVLMPVGHGYPIPIVDGEFLVTQGASPLPEFVRLTYHRSAGGAANQLQVQVIGRQ